MKPRPAPYFSSGLLHLNNKRPSRCGTSRLRPNPSLLSRTSDTFCSLAEIPHAILGIWRKDVRNDEEIWAS